MDRRINPINVLEKLEQFRMKLHNREITPGSEDWVVRACQAIVADAGEYQDRASWVQELRKRDYSRTKRFRPASINA